jgi:DNA-binding transcriptional ArsR family regulator
LLSMSPDELTILDESAKLRPLISPLRRRLLENLRDPESAVGLSRRLGLPRQKINYHLRELEREGFLELVEERRRRGRLERVLRATATAYLVSSEFLGELAADPDTFQDRFSSAYLIALASQLVRDVAELQRGAAQTNKRLATMALQVDVRFASAADRAAFADELAGTIARLAAKYHQPGPQGRRHRFVIGGHPTRTKTKVEE